MALLLQAGAASADFAAGQAAYQAGKYHAAYEEWSAEAWKDDARAQEGLGRILESGAGKGRDLYEAYIWYRVADFHDGVDLTDKPAELAARLPQADLGWLRQRAHARYVEILDRKNRPEPELNHITLTEPAQKPDQLHDAETGYTWMCDCASAETPEDDENYQGFDIGIGSKLTF